MNKSLEKFNSVVQMLKETNSASEKIKMLSAYKNDPEIIKYFFYTYNPFLYVWCYFCFYEKRIVICLNWNFIKIFLKF